MKRVVKWREVNAKWEDGIGLDRFVKITGASFMHRGDRVFDVPFNDREIWMKSVAGDEYLSDTLVLKIEPRPEDPAFIAIDGITLFCDHQVAFEADVDPQLHLNLGALGDTVRFEFNAAAFEPRKEGSS